MARDWKLQTGTPEAADTQHLSWMFFTTLRRVHRNLEVHSRDLERKFGLTAPQLCVLWAIGTHGSVPMGQVADRVSLSSAAVTSIVDRLEAHGLVSRERSIGDKRRVIVSLTPASREILSQEPQPFPGRFVARLAELESWQQTELLSALQRIAAMMEPRGGPGEPFDSPGSSG